MSMRLFVGIALSPEVTDELTRLTARLRRADDRLRWSAPESWHVTLEFVGAAEQDQYECVVARLREIHRPPVPIRLEAPGFFDRAGIFFVGVHSSPELTSLERHVVAATTLCGFEPEMRPYHPHITLARSRGKDGDHGLRRLKDKLHSAHEFTLFTAEDFLLYESKPTPGGSIYEVRERFTLQAVR
jgi:RNA 2',3'-cyclic 3'-phosphodiesterase